MSRSTVSSRRAREGQRDLLVDVAVDGERPRVDVDGGDREARVDAVEVGVRRPQRADAVVLRLQPGGKEARGRWRPAARCRSRRGGTTSPSDRAPPWPLRPRRGRRSPARPRAGSDRRPRATSDRRPWSARHGAATTARWRRRRRRPGQERCPAARSPGAGRRARRRRRRAPRAMSRPTVSRGVAPGSPATAASSSDDDGHRADEHRLVGGAELPDRPLLERGRRQVDDGRADREHGRGGRHGEGGDEVGGREADDRREHAVRRVEQRAGVGAGCGVCMAGVRSGRARGWAARWGASRMTAMTDAPELVHYAVADAVATITLDSPQTATRSAASW